VADGLRRFLVTAELGTRMDLWATTATFTNWLEGRGPAERETWMVMCPGEYGEAFLEASRQLGATVEEIDGAGDGERYVLRVGEPGTGWQPPKPRKQPRTHRLDAHYPARTACGLDSAGRSVSADKDSVTCRRCNPFAEASRG
jgi:hypothetical protein